ncbi:hypothetical protein [Pseudomonas sp. RIT-PI-S]|uniref:hypothetical protein n=1 Tax=Pseudomonas sp. RIT-PI-S TaxID=3035295 RepID=UPI0021D9258B|nr:hypothetical protein [Pseudomonas sp. RIT-PI-S]
MSNAAQEFHAWWARQPFNALFEEFKQQMCNVWVASRAQYVVRLDLGESPASMAREIQKGDLRWPAGKALRTQGSVPPDGLWRDDDNLLAMFKAGRDGLADAQGVDDSIFATQIRLSEEIMNGGAVRVRIEALAGEAA